MLDAVEDGFLFLLGVVDGAAAGKPVHLPAQDAFAAEAQDEPQARVRAALGTGLVTVPLGGLGWALLSSSGRSAAGLGDVLGMTALAAVAPLVLAVAFVAADRRR